MFDQSLINFFIVVAVQLAFFLAQILVVRKGRGIPKLLLSGMLIGIPFGILTDLVWGKWVGVFTYQLGFVPWFLLLNGLFSYGVWMANVLLLRTNSFKQIYAVTAMLAVVYEVANYYFPVWEWTFGTSFTEYVTVIFVFYPSLTLFAVCLLRFGETRLRQWRR